PLRRRGRDRRAAGRADPLQGAGLSRRRPAAGTGGHSRGQARQPGPPMIIGLANDLCDISRVQKTLDTYGDRFTHRCFTELERNKSDRRAQRAASYAKRFAAKEACSKALGTGMSWGVYWRDLGVVNLPSGKPTMKLTNGAAK